MSAAAWSLGLLPSCVSCDEAAKKCDGPSSLHCIPKPRPSSSAPAATERDRPSEFPTVSHRGSFLLTFLLQLTLYLPLLSQLSSLVFYLAQNRRHAIHRQYLFLQTYVDIFKGVFTYPTRRRLLRQTKSEPRNVSGEGNLLQNWMMKALPSNDVELSSLTLPGTHNSHAYKLSIPAPMGTCWIQCQNITIFHQLCKGVRLLDLRYKSLDHFGHGPGITSRVDRVVRDILDYVMGVGRGEVIVCLVRRLSSFRHFLDQERGGNDREKSFGRKLFFPSAVQFFGASLHSELDNRPKDVAPRIVLLDNALSTTFYRQKTLAELTDGGKNGVILVDSWHHWEGSWGYTRSNRVEVVIEKCRDWITSVSPSRSVNDAANATMSSSVTTMPKTWRPRLMEFVVTIDYGTIGTIVRLALTQSIRTMAALLEEYAYRDGFFNAALAAEDVQAVIFDYPTDAVLRTVVNANIARMRRRSNQQKTER